MRTSNKLSVASVRSMNRPGRYADGGGLYLQISKIKTKAWLFRFMQHGRARQMGLGTLAVVSLHDAREKARDCQRLLLSSIDPIEARRADRMKERAAATRGITFKDCAEKYIKAHEDSWRNEKHRAQWTNKRLRERVMP